MPRVSGYLLFLLLILLPSMSMANRIAILVGNGDYKFTSKLTNPINDAGGMASLLNEHGFDVHLFLDTPRAQLASAFSRLLPQITEKTDVLFFYAGTRFAICQ